MIIGIDLDNTLACYDGLFHEEAVARALIPASLSSDKTSVRDHLRKIGKEDEWTELQGHVYGPGMTKAKPYPGALDFVKRCKKEGARVVVISHRTPKPFRGPAHDLHASARAWLDENGFTAELGEDWIFLEATKEDKLKRIGRLRCDDFVDDLPEFLSEPGFPVWTRRWLFQGPEAGEFPPVPSWPEAEKLFFESARPAGADALIPGKYSLRLLPGAANNKVYLVEREKGKAVLKSYFRSPGDKRDRLGAEWAFSRFAWDAGLRQLPEPLACDEKAGLALYGFVEGQKAAADADGLKQCLEFLRALNAKGKPGLPQASEACFSLAQHVETIEGRVARLKAEIDDPEAKKAAWEISSAWQAVKAKIKRESTELSNKERIISPSDFGFHNALKARDGRLVFLDFEYAGWDDPAKLVCDFFCQPAVPVPQDQFARFADEVAKIAGGQEARRRMDLLRPAYELKWCCILLNEFTSTGKARRRFASAPALKQAQLRKVREMLARRVRA